MPQGAYLNGTWGTVMNGQQVVMQINGNQYAFWTNGVMTEMGVCQVQGNVIAGQNQMGVPFRNVFQLDPTGRILMMTTQQGFTTTWQRLQ